MPSGPGDGRLSGLSGRRAAQGRRGAVCVLGSVGVAVGSIGLLSAINDDREVFRSTVGQAPRFGLRKHARRFVPCCD